MGDDGNFVLEPTQHANWLAEVNYKLVNLSQKSVFCKFISLPYWGRQPSKLVISATMQSLFDLMQALAGCIQMGNENQVCAKEERAFQKCLKNLAEQSNSCKILLQNISASGDKRIVFQFDKAKELLKFEQTLLDCIRLGKEYHIRETMKDKNYVKPFEPWGGIDSAGPFRHGTGGGWRNIRDSKTFS
jgi:hypothetical protein